MKPTLLKYHPVRYEYDLRDLINYVVSEYYKTPEEEIQKYGGLLINGIFQEELEVMLKNNPGSLPLGMDKESWCQYKEELFGAFLHYESAGENIFHIQPELLGMFQKTDVSQVRIDELRAPYDSIYLYFGDTNEFAFGDDKYIDGAYVENSHEQELVFIYLTTRNTKTPHGDLSVDELEFLNSEPHLYHLLVGEPGEGEIVGKSLEETIKESGSENYNKAQFRFWEPHLRSVTNIVINALCFMASEHSDNVSRFPDNCPEAFSEKLKKATTKKQRNRILSKASSQGFRTLNFIGDTYRNRIESSSGQIVSTHWRRGHWRHQVHGRDRAQHKLIWIKPTIVNKGVGDSQIKHIYNVDEKDS